MLQPRAAYADGGAASVVDPGRPRGPGPPLDPKFEAPDYILRPKLHLLTHK